MIREELVENDTRVRHYSDADLHIRQIETGVIYEDAVDYIPCAYTYEETDIPIEHDTDDAAELLSIIVGGENA